jgi:hypothetical protein
MWGEYRSELGAIGVFERQDQPATLRIVAKRRASLAEDWWLGATGRT